MNSKKKKVYIIGAGPGDRELISLKGYKIIKKADCILYDFLANKDLLKFTKKGSKKICVGKKDGSYLKNQNEINKMLYENSLKYKIVVRLKGGDPFIFSRGYEEARYLSKKGVNFELIPGITSAIAAPESFGIPLTLKNRIQSFAVITGRKKKKNATIDAPNCGTLVYVMAVSNISNVVKSLVKSGRDISTPCAFIENSTLNKARIVRATLSTIEKEAKLENIKPPSILVVGEVLNYSLRFRDGKSIKK